MRTLVLITVAMGILLTAGCGKMSGKASYYSDDLHGKKTASGEAYDKNALTAAHPKLPFGTKVRVTNIENGKSVIVRINDRGPHTGGRVIDLSRAAAAEIGLLKSGIAQVKLETVEETR